MRGGNDYQDGDGYVTSNNEEKRTPNMPLSLQTKDYQPVCVVVVVVVPLLKKPISSSYQHALKTLTPSPPPRSLFSSLPIYPACRANRSGPGEVGAV